MDILVKVKVSEGNKNNRHYVDRVINLRYMTKCKPSDEGTTFIYLTDPESDCECLQIKYENFIVFLKKLYGNKFIELEDHGVKFEEFED